MCLLSKALRIEESHRSLGGPTTFNLPMQLEGPGHFIPARSLKTFLEDRNRHWPWSHQRIPAEKRQVYNRATLGRALA